jgi:hypothetical protein
MELEISTRNGKLRNRGAQKEPGGDARLSELRITLEI